MTQTRTPEMIELHRVRGQERRAKNALARAAWGPERDAAQNAWLEACVATTAAERAAYPHRRYANAR